MRRFSAAVLALAGGIAIGGIALHRHEPINALWIITAAVCIYLLGYRFYAAWIATRVLMVDASRATPAERLNNGRDFVPTHRAIVFGHHFAAIAGPGPLVGPTLAAQFGYLPGTLWILVGAVLGGCVQDMTILLLSTRRDGRSLGQMARDELGPLGGFAALIGTLLILIVLSAVLGLVIVNAMKHSPWATSTVAATIPVAILVGLYLRSWRPGRVLEASLIGVTLVLAAVLAGGWLDHQEHLRRWFDYAALPLAAAVVIYAWVAATLPVWLLLAPRDYLSTFLKIGAIAGLALGILLVMPPLKMAAVTRFIDGTGPVFSGALFPFLFITIACGAVSGFHALISSGTTPKMIENETQIPFVGYGGMLMESFVAIMAMVAASVIEPGVYFAMNSPSGLIGTDAAKAAAMIGAWGFTVTPDMLTDAARNVGETTVLSRAGGAPTLAVGMAEIFSNVLGGKALMGFWYHFAILFEALFILTAVDAGTRACRFMVQDMIGAAFPAFRNTESWINNLLATTIAVAMWGYILYTGVVDPLGGINTLWPLFGISNQMLAGIALITCTVLLFKMKRQKYAWVAATPALWLLICTLTAGLQKVFHSDPAIGFLSHASRFGTALAEGKLLAPAQNIGQMRQIVFNDYVDATLAFVFVLVVVCIFVFGLLEIGRARANDRPTMREIGAEQAGIVHA